MNEEERQRQMDFILNQQAQFAADIQKLEAAQKRTDETLNRTVEALSHLAEVTLAGFQEMRDGFKVMRDGFKEVRENIAALTAKQAETDARLNNLIIVVERHISEGHRGTSRSE